MLADSATCNLRDITTHDAEVVQLAVGKSVKLANSAMVVAPFFDRTKHVLFSNSSVCLKAI